MAEKILVVRLGSLGDFIKALGTMEAVRRHHQAAHITLLTTQPFLDIAQRSGYFDDIIIDTPPKFYEIRRWIPPLKKRKAGFTMIYDLQSDKLSGIDVQIPDLSWMASDIGLFGLKNPYVLLIPGASPQHPAKRWPAKYYGALALKVAREGYQPVIIGTAIEKDVTERITKLCPEVLDLSGKTSLYDIATLARGAAMAIGNDTGPTHLIALVGCPTIALFCTAESTVSPAGKSVQVLEANDLNEVPISLVYKKFKPETAAR